MRRAHVLKCFYLPLSTFLVDVGAENSSKTLQQLGWELKEVKLRRLFVSTTQTPRQKTYRTSRWFRCTARENTVSYNQDTGRRIKGFRVCNSAYLLGLYSIQEAAHKSQCLYLVSKREKSADCAAAPAENRYNLLIQWKILAMILL